MHITHRLFFELRRKIVAHPDGMGGTCVISFQRLRVSPFITSKKCPEIRAELTHCARATSMLQITPLHREKGERFTRGGVMGADTAAKFQKAQLNFFPLREGITETFHDFHFSRRNMFAAGRRLRAPVRSIISRRIQFRNRRRIGRAKLQRIPWKLHKSRRVRISESGDAARGRQRGGGARESPQTRESVITVMISRSSVLRNSATVRPVLARGNDIARCVHRSCRCASPIQAGGDALRRSRALSCRRFTRNSPRKRDEEGTREAYSKGCWLAPPPVTASVLAAALAMARERGREREKGNGSKTRAGGTDLGTVLSLSVSLFLDMDFTI